MRVNFSAEDVARILAIAVANYLHGLPTQGNDLLLISALALGEYVSGRVGQLARQKGHDQDAVFKTAQEELHSFPIGEVIGTGQ